MGKSSLNNRKNKIVPVILSGGSGTRLWPLSRSAYPKQFLEISANGLTLIQETAKRFINKKQFYPPIVICNVEHRFIVAEQLRMIGVDKPSIILEPEGRNTAPALTIASLYIQQKYKKDLQMIVLPADHVIEEPKKLLKVIEVGVKAKEKLLAFGIKPKYPETNYGYIEYVRSIVNKGLILKIKKFVEKPELKKAEKYIKAGNYLWNSGIFLFSAESYLKEIKKYQPDILRLCKKSLTNKNIDLDFIRLEEPAFLKLPSISIDYAVMEKTDKAAVIPLDCGWSDVGSWNSLWNFSPKDKNGNVAEGKAHIIDTKNSYVRGDGAAVYTLGVDNLVIVSTKDAILVMNKASITGIKGLVEKIKKGNKELVGNHTKVFRPWGSYESMHEGDKYKVKHLNIKPREKLSLQMHSYRSEHWVVVRGKAKVIIEKKEHIISPNQSLYVPAGAKHSLENIGNESLDIIEVQVGSYLGEDDIVRFEDKYNRVCSS